MTFKLVVFSLGFLVFTGCSSCSESVTGDVNAGNSNTNVIVPRRAANMTPQSNSGSNANIRPYPGMKEGENPTLDNSKVKVIDTSKIKREPVTKKGPDNSEMWTIMNSQGQVIETRRFLNHNQLEKVERITKTPKDVIVKVHLRNGKVVQVADKKISNFKINTANQILTAAGVKIEMSTDPDGPKKKGAMKNRPLVKSPVSENE